MTPAPVRTVPAAAHTVASPSPEHELETIRVFMAKPTSSALLRENPGLFLRLRVRRQILTAKLAPAQAPTTKAPARPRARARQPRRTPACRATESPGRPQPSPAHQVALVLGQVA